MVEFGLKLEDNKVSEWSDYYIKYEKLKSILKKLSNTRKKYNDLSKKYPEIASRVEEAHERGGGMGSRTNSIGSFISMVSGSNTNATKDSNNNNNNNNNDTLDTNSLVNERTNLLVVKSTPPKQNNNDNNNEDEEDDDAKSVGGASITSLTSVKTPLGFVTEYLEVRSERQMQEMLKEIDRIDKDFNMCLLDNIKIVNDFYAETLTELENRHSLLVENVLSSFQNLQKQKAYQNKIRVEGQIDEATAEEEEEQHKPVDDKEGEDEKLIKDEEKKEDAALPITSPVARAKRFLQLASQKMMSRGNLVVGIQQSQQKMKLELDESLPGQLEKHHRTTSSAVSASVSVDLNGLDDDDVVDIEGVESGQHPFHKKNVLNESESIQRALFDEYRRAKLLHNFTIMNYTGFVKIVKKYDKNAPAGKKGQYKEAIKSENVCGAGKGVETLSKIIEKRYAKWFCDNNITQAIAQLLPKQGDGLQMDWSQLRLGYRMGMCAVLAFWIFWDCVWGLVAEGNSTIGGRTGFPVFRACGGLLLLQWFWGCSVYIWTRYRVNYIFLFDFNPRIVSSPLSIFNDAVDNTLFFMVCMLLYYKSGVHDMPNWAPPGIFPLILIIRTVLKLIFPLKVRVPMWKAIWKVVTAPSTSPNFFHGYVGDILTSMVKVFQDIAWTVCFVVSGDFLIWEDMDESLRHPWSNQFWYKNILIPLICLLPLWFRFNQCLRRYLDTGNRWPHLANAFKYALSQTVTLFGAFHPLYLLHRHKNNQTTTGTFNLFQFFWMSVFIASSLYSFTWDVIMDWGLGRPKDNFLGPRLMYPRKGYYYTIMALDLVLRFMWVLTLVPPKSGAKFEVPQYLAALSLMLELFRRTIWGFLRLENEHRSNTHGYRRVDFVPLHFKTGHTHQYKAETEHSGWGVLAEVAAVTFVVLAVCIYSVVTAQRAARNID